ncbi:hypothetical protein HK405_010195, partial [Cladochytrium tenue]
DEAARRRLVKRIYIPLPGTDARLALLRHLLRQHPHALSDADFDTLAERTDGFSCSDIAALAREASLGPVRDLELDDLLSRSTTDRDSTQSDHSSSTTTSSSSSSPVPDAVAETDTTAVGSDRVVHQLTTAAGSVRRSPDQQQQQQEEEQEHVVQRPPPPHTAGVLVLRPIALADFTAAAVAVRPSVSLLSVDAYDRWNAEFGASG